MLHTRMKIILIHFTHRIPAKFHYTKNTYNNMNCPLPAGAFHSIPLFTFNKVCRVINLLVKSHRPQQQPTHMIQPL